DSQGILPSAQGKNAGRIGMPHFGKTTRTALTALGLALLCACSPIIAQEGNVPDPDQVVQINPGVDDKNRVTQVLGSPSTVSSFQDRTWYYISRRTEPT